MRTQFIYSEKGTKIKAIIGIKEYKHYQELLEEEEDIIVFDKVLEENNKTPPRPLEDILEEMDLSYLLNK